MMQDVDGVSWYIDTLVHQYTINASRLHAEDATIRQFAYSFDIFHRCHNPRHVTAPDALSISITIFSSPSIPTLYHSSIKFLPFFPFVLFILFNNKPLNIILPVPGTPSPPITWISFDPVINSLAPLLFSQGYNALQYIICESDQLSFSLAEHISPDATISLTTFTHTLSSLQHRLSLLSTNPSSSSNLLPNQLIKQTNLPYPSTSHQMTILYRMLPYPIALSFRIIP